MCTSSIAECHTKCDFMDIVLPEDKQPRCSTPKPAELSLTFQDDPMDTTYEPSLEDSGPTGAQLAGDSRVDSPGYSAKYGTYSLLDTSLNRIIDMQLVQSNEVTSSGAMELEGLKRALKGLEDQKVCVRELVTYRHTQVRKHMRQNRPDIAHLIDAWHVAKGLKKKLQAVSRSRGCGVIEKWETSIINHFYFSVRIAAARVMTAERRGELAVAIWLSLLNHIQNKHCGHSKEYANCEHGDLLPRKWIFPGTDAFDKLRGIVENNRLLLDIKQVSPSFQTSSLESFHSVLNQFAPKSFTFSFHGMLARGRNSPLEDIVFYTDDRDCECDALREEDAAVGLHDVGNKCIGLNGTICSSVNDGAQTSVYLAVSEEVEGVSGRMFSDCKPSFAPGKSQDAEALWDISQRIAGLC
ncbi:hypothetical protein HPB49_005092 [Dermacentor silvarum]|uniref:Uncharacterized protein n=1 Tax=Dermacentor silvarum TaxID=543639 RepID=A0ACB8DMV6_DERSI|nr:hypothetical protein HPB49_005092 [Dermacentor silvarum]